jgi:hypothetical protein
MIDPTNITNYNMTTPQLQEFILFWVCAAGKNGKSAARAIDSLLKTWRPVAADFIKNPWPFDIIRQISLRSDLPDEMRKHGIGCYNNKAKTFLQLVYSALNLKTCLVDDLEAIDGIGPKTARCFLIHSRQDQQFAALDTHVLKFLKDMGYKVPKSTPAGKSYKAIEKTFVYLAGVAGYTNAAFDLLIWNAYSGNKGKPEDVLGIFGLPLNRSYA